LAGIVNWRCVERAASRSISLEAKRDNSARMLRPKANVRTVRIEEPKKTAKSAA
jgi:hypothetical protein